jgi:hypothetical protein
MGNRTNQILESISFLSGFDLLSAQAPPLALQKKPQQISYIGEIIVDQRLAYTRFAPDAIHRQGRNTIARNNLCNMIKDERLSLAWGEADPFLGLRQSTSFGIRHRVATFNNFHTRQTRSREPLSLFACSGWFARHKQKGQG